MTKSQNIKSMIKEIAKKGISIKQANCFATNLLPIDIDLVDIASDDSEDKFSHHYTYDDDSILIIDDEGYVYCHEDSEIEIVCKY